ncbi:hypothetical protein BGZ90_004062 [Linnemannia elongata]|nr:hypothetical protein BGZ90_004062 [Linnemannia elongata]
MVISCRTQFLGPTYVDRFKPHPTDRYAAGSQDLFQEAVITPFSKDQIQQYVSRYIKELPTVDPLQDRPPWNADECMDKLNRIPNLMDLVSNPFLLRLALDALPSVVGSNKELSAIKLTRVQLYDGFVKRWLEVNQERLGTSTLSNDERRKLNVLIEEDNFLYHSIHYQKSLALSIFSEQAGNPVVKYNHTRDENTWKAVFFCPEGRDKLLFESSTVMRSGALFRFLHRSLLEYFYSRTIYDPLDHDSDDHEIGLMTSLSRMNIVEEPSIIQFLCDRVSQDPNFERKLRAVIDQSKTDFNATIAATNAITILVRAGVAFHGADLRGIKIPGADLSYGQFDSAQFQKANLKSVNLSGSWLRQADLSDAQLEGVRFGELPYLKSLAYSPRGNDIASASHDNTVRLWDSETGMCVVALKGHTDWVMSVRFSPNGRHLVSGSRDEMIRFWDSETGKPVNIWSPLLGEIYSIAISPDDRWIASGHYDGNVQLWDMVSGSSGLVLQGHTQCVTGIAFSPDGQLIATSSRDRRVKLWDASTGDVISTFDGHSKSIEDVAFSPDGLTIASGSDDGTVRLWEASSSWRNIETQDLIGDTCQVAYSPDGLSVLSVNHRKVVQRDATTGLRSSVLFELPRYIYSTTLSADGSQIAGSYLDSSVQLWNSHTGVEGPVFGGSVFTGRLSEARILTFSTSGRWIATCDKEAIVQLLDLRNGKQRRVPVEGGGDDKDRISDLKFSPTGHQLAICSRDGIVWLFDTQTRILLTSKKLREEAILALDYSPKGDQLALGTPASVALWDLQSDEPSLELKDAASSEDPFDRWVTVAVAYSPCGQFLASANENYIVHLWRRWSVEGDKETWSCTFALCVFYGFTISLSWNPVVPMELMTCSENGSVRVWRVSSEEGTVAVKMLWGTNLRRLCSAGVVLKRTTGLNPIHRKLLAQRRAFYRGLSSDDNGSDDGSEDDDGFDDGFEDGLEDGFEGGCEDGLEDDDGFNWIESDDGSEVEK